MDGNRLFVVALLAAMAGSGVIQAQQAFAPPPLSAGGWMGSGEFAGGVVPTGTAYPDLESPMWDGQVNAVAWNSECGCNEVVPSCCSEYCCAPAWTHRSGVYGELLVLRPRNAEVAYAVPFNGAVVAGVPPVQVGPVGVAVPNYSTGFRFGVTKALDDCSSISLSYSLFQSNVNDNIAQAPIRAMVLHPGSANAAQNFLTAAGNVGVDFDLIDLDYRAIWNSCDCWAVNYLIGVRYARLDQDFNGVFTQVGNTELVRSNTNFEGAGLRLGVDGERHAASGLLVYGRAAASLVAGEVGSGYTQGSTAQPVIVNTQWHGTRVMPILDLEVGAGWQSACGRYRITGGYLLSSWFNTLNNDTWIQGVQNNNFVDLSDTLTFDGLTARVEYRF